MGPNFDHDPSFWQVAWNTTPGVSSQVNFTVAPTALLPVKSLELDLPFGLSGPVAGHAGKIKNKKCRIEDLKDSEL